MESRKTSPLNSKRIWTKLALISAIFIASQNFAPKAKAFEEALMPLPDFIGPAEYLSPPNTNNLRRLRFLTSTDFPPFNFINSQGDLTGFQVEVAREICRSLNMSARCQIQALPFSELTAALKDDRGDALIAGHAMTEQSLEELAFSPSFFKFPARFYTHKDKKLREPSAVQGKIGVLDKSAHQAYLKAYFTDFELETFDTREALQTAIFDKQIDAAFDDAMSTSFWLATEKGNCCAFMADAFYSEVYFGHGLQIATAKENELAQQIVTYGLHALRQSGKLQELYLRYFPVPIH